MKPRLLPAAPVYPIEMGPDKRTLYDQTGARFTIHGEAAWSLIVQLTLAEAETYLEDRRAKGFNAIYVNLIEHRFSDQNPAWNNRAGEPPFDATLSGGLLDFAQPNEAYWAHVDAVLDLAAQKGILVLAFPAYVGYQFNDAGWAAEMQANGVDGCRSYGAWLGQRYADRNNIWWVMGGDWAPEYLSTDIRPHVNALAEGIEGAVPASQWITAHSYRNQMGIDDYDEPWLDVNTVYARYILSRNDVTVAEEMKEGHARSGPRPFFFIEGQYENEYGLDARGVRYQAYTAVLGGAAGHFYGNNPIWAFEAADLFADDTGLSWQQALDLPGALDMVHLGDLIRSRFDDVLVPDYEHEILVEGFGNLADESYASCAFTPDCRFVTVYTPEQRTLGIDLTHFFEGDRVVATWFDPRTGDTGTPETLDNTGTLDFVPPASGDWVLMLDRIVAQER